MAVSVCADRPICLNAPDKLYLLQIQNAPLPVDWCLGLQGIQLNIKLSQTFEGSVFLLRQSLNVRLFLQIFFNTLFFLLMQ